MRGLSAPAPPRGFRVNSDLQAEIWAGGRWRAQAELYEVGSRGGKTWDIRGYKEANGGTWADAFAAAIADIPAITAYGAVGRPTNGGVIYVPWVDPDGDDPLVLPATVVIPAGKAVEVAGMGTYLPAVVCTDPSGIAFQVEGGSDFQGNGGGARPFSFRNLNLFGGGIDIGQGVRNSGQIEYVMFNDITTRPAVQMGEGVVNVGVTRCFFSGCAGGVWVTDTSSDLIYVDFCAFVRGLDVDVMFNSYDCRVQQCDFESRHTAHRDKPHVQLTQGFAQVLRNRFVSDSGGTFGSPTNTIVLGSLGSFGDTALLDGRIEGNRFSRVEDASATACNAYIRINIPLHGWKIDGNTYNQEPFAAYIDNEYQASGSNPERTSDNTYSGNTHYYRRTVPIFKRNSQGWSGVVDGGFLNQRLDAGRSSGNLLKDPDDFSTAQWTRTTDTGGTPTFSVARSTTGTELGPDGVVDSFWVFTKSAVNDGAALVKSASVTAVADTELVGSVWLKAGTLNRARVAIRDITAARYVTSDSRSFLLPDLWDRVFVRANTLTGGHQYQLWVYAGSDSDAALATLIGGTIKVARPQLEVGTTPTPSHHTTGSNVVRAPRQFQSLTLGNRVVGYGTAAPVSGRYEVGDIVLNTAATAVGDAWGWQCLVAGPPGTWITLANLGSTDPLDVMREVDDFVSGNNTSGSIGKLGWMLTVVGSGAISYVSGEAGHWGILQLTTGATANSSAALSLRQTPASGLFLPADMFDVSFVSRIGQTNADAEAVYRLGVGNSPAAVPPATSDMSIERLGGETNWYAKRRVSGGDARTDMGVAQAQNTWRRPRIRRLDGSTVRYSIAGTDVDVTTGLPAGSVSPMVQVANGASGGAKTLDLDLFTLLGTGLGRS